MTSDPKPFPPEVVAAICRHMNEDHQLDCLALARGPGRRPRATAATMVGVDRVGFDLLARVDGRDEPVRIEWGRELRERSEVREALAGMVRQLHGDG